MKTFRSDVDNNYPTCGYCGYMRTLYLREGGVLFFCEQGFGPTEVDPEDDACDIGLEAMRGDDDG